jgi:hypothetical protein
VIRYATTATLVARDGGGGVGIVYLSGFGICVSN